MAGYVQNKGKIIRKGKPLNKLYPQKKINFVYAVTFLDGASVPVFKAASKNR